MFLFRSVPGQGTKALKARWKWIRHRYVTGQLSRAQNSGRRCRRDYSIGPRGSLGTVRSLSGRTDAF